MTEAPATRRRWFQFGMGTTFLLLTMFCLATVALKVHNDNVRLREKIEILQKEIEGMRLSAATSRALLFLQSHQSPPDPMPVLKDRAGSQRQKLLNTWDLPERTFIHPESRFDDMPESSRRHWLPEASLPLDARQP